MVTNSKDYEELLWQIQSNAPTEKAILLPTDEQIFDIDLGTRKISVPKFLSVRNDHQAETVYFKFDRYYENVDLTTMGCVIEYTNAANDTFIYPVPFYDIYNAAHENKVIIPWCIQGQATVKAGTIKFAICFFKVNANHKIGYALNTLVAESQILAGQNVEDLELSQDEITLDASLLELIQSIQQFANEGALALYWVDV